MPDHRTKRQKLEDLANHPRTPPNEAAAARRALGRDTQADTPKPDTGPIHIFVAGVDVTDKVRWGKQPGGRSTGPYVEDIDGFRQYAERLAQHRSPKSCPGCRHRSELHSVGVDNDLRPTATGGICFMCKRSGAPPCDWHYEYAEVDLDGNASWARERAPGWYRNE